MADIESFMAALMDGAHPHSLNAKGKGDAFRCVGCFTGPGELLDRAAVETAQGHDVWFGVHPLREPLDAGRRGGAGDVAGVRVLPADLDWRDSTAHAAEDLPTEAEVRARLARFEHPPTFIVESGHGLQAYWRLSRDLAPDEGAALILRLHAALQAAGLVTEREDLASVLRVPGTVNYKADPVDVRLDGCAPERRYQPEYLAKRLPAVGGRPGGPARRGGGRWRDLDREALHEADREALELLEEAGGRTRSSAPTASCRSPAPGTTRATT